MLSPGVAMRGTAGKPIHFLGICIDVTRLELADIILAAPARIVML
jgi:hypothetical protein